MSVAMKISWIVDYNKLINYNQRSKIVDYKNPDFNCNKNVLKYKLQ